MTTNKAAGRLSLGLMLLALLFAGLSLAQLGLVNRNLTIATFGPWLVLAVCGGASIWLLYFRRQTPADPVLLPLIFMLSGFGLALIARLAPAFIFRQTIWLAVSTIFLLLVTLLPKNLNWLRRYKYTWLGSGLLLLAATLLFGVNPSGYGARLWLPLGGIYFQPSEPLKLLLVVFLAGYMAHRYRQLTEARTYIGRLALPHPSYFGPMLLMWGFSIILLVWQRDLGAALLFFGTFLGMLYAATGQTRYLWAGALLLAVAVILGFFLFDVVKLRVEAFLNPWLDPSGRSFQIVQSLLAFGAGGIFGQGLGQGLPTAIPVVHTDFVFAAIGEEYGLLGALAVLLLFALLVGRAFHIAIHARQPFQQLLAAGIGTMLGLQTIIITAGTLKLIPLTGVTLPFVSYGGSSLVSSFIMVGVLMFIAAEPAAPDQMITHTPFIASHLRLARMLLTGLAVSAGGLALWQVVAAPFLLSRADNPRPIIAAQKINRGSLLTAEGIPVAETVFVDGLARRRYPYPELSAVTGYYSLRYGAGGAEFAFDRTLRGEAETVDNLLHRPPVGRDVMLTINLPAQVAADVALGGQEGAVVLLDVSSGAILAMASHPTYDPNMLDEQWDTLRGDARAPLLNRAAQGLFPVGTLARLIGWIGLHEAGAHVPPNPQTAPLAELLTPLGEIGYQATARQLGLIQPLTNLPSQPGRLPNFDAAETARDLAVTPLHLARVVAALERGGALPQATLRVSAQSVDGEQISFGPETARKVRQLLPPVEAQIIGLTGLASPQETGQQWLSWFVGLAPAQGALHAKAMPEILPFNPAEAGPAPTLAPPVEFTPARYAVVVVIVTDTPDETLALRAARGPLGVLLSVE
jgi:cell division protein FtsW (lipid II flippase)